MANSKTEEFDPKPDPKTAPKEEKEPELSQAEKDQILREAVSFYLRQDFRDATIRKVCEEYIAGVDKAVRATVDEGAAPQTSSHHHPSGVPVSTGTSTSTPSTHKKA